MNMESFNAILTGKAGISKKRMKQLLAGSIPFFTFLMFGGALGFEGVMQIAWESGYLPLIPDTPFPETISKVSPAFTIVALFGAPIRLLTAGLSQKYELSQNIGRPGKEDIPIFLLYYAIYLGAVVFSGIPLTNTNILGGAVAMGLLLLYTSTPVYVTEDPTVPNKIDNTIDGLYVVTAALFVVSVMSLAGIYALAIVQMV